MPGPRFPSEAPSNSGKGGRVLEMSGPVAFARSPCLRLVNLYRERSQVPPVLSAAEMRSADSGAEMRSKASITAPGGRPWHDAPVMRSPTPSRLLIKLESAQE